MQKPVRIWWMLTLRGALFFLLGYIIFRVPANALLAQEIYISMAFLLSGALQMIAALAGYRMSSRWWWLSNGILDLLFGLIILRNPVLTPNFFPLLLAFWALSAGAIQLGSAFEYRREDMSRWWSGLVGGILLLLFAFLIFRLFKDGSSFAISLLLALQMVFVGGYTILLSMQIRGMGRDKDAVSSE